MTSSEAALKVFDQWYRSLRSYSSSGGPARGTIGAALVVLERLKEDCQLELKAHRAPGGSQIQGASGAAVAEILAQFGEVRPFLSEGGRTNRGGPDEIAKMLQALETANLSRMAPEARGECPELR